MRTVAPGRLLDAAEAGAWVEARAAFALGDQAKLRRVLSPLQSVR